MSTGTGNDDVHNDDDNEVVDCDPYTDLVVRGSVAGNNDQEITANIRGEENCWDFYGRFRLFAKVRKQGIGAFSQYIYFSGNRLSSMR